MNNKIKLPETVIDFPSEVGLTGQDHDDYASPGSPTRYDWMRSIILGLLSNQASSEEPTEYRSGTLHFDLENFIYKCVKNGNFENLAKCLKVNSTNLNDWAQTIEEIRSEFKSTGTFSGIAHNSSKTISIPKNLQPIAIPSNKPHLFINGKMIDPSKLKFNSGCPVAIELLDNISLSAGDTFVAFIK